MENDKKPVVATSAFIKKDNKYLLVFDPGFGFWRVPGSGPSFGERVEDALKREMKEELNIEIDIIKFLGFGQDTVTRIEKRTKASRLLLYFECEIKKGEIKATAPNEISEMKWLSPCEIKKHQNTEPGMIDFFKKFDFCKPKKLHIKNYPSLPCIIFFYFHLMVSARLYLCPQFVFFLVYFFSPAHGA